MSTYTIKDIEFQLRLEPIVSLSDGNIIGYEALSRLTKNTQKNIFDYEFFFSGLKRQEHLFVIKKQMEIYKKWCINIPDIYKKKKLFINVSPLVLDDLDSCFCLMDFLQNFPIAIEVDSKCHDLSKKATINAATLQYFGAQMWIDDVHEHEHIHGSFWNGIKIDRHSFQSSFSSVLSSSNLNRYRAFTNIGPIIIEGIETEEHLEYAKSLGARFGQGYLWKAVQKNSQLSLFNSTSLVPSLEEALSTHRC